LSELFDYLKEKYSKNPERTLIKDKMNIQRVTNNIALICETYLKEAGQVLSFEVDKKDLSYVIQAIDDESLTSMYDIVQVSETMFNVSLKEIQL